MRRCVEDRHRYCWLRRPQGVNIVVTVKQVPDTWAEKKLDASDKTVDRKSVDNVMNEMDEYGVEEALKIKEAHGGEVTVVTMGPEKAVETIRKALSMGADKAVHLTDESLHGSDALATSAALAKVISTLSPDLIITSSEASDARGGVMGALLAERLGLPQLTQARKVTVDPGANKVSVERLADNGYALVEATLPAVVGVVEKINQPRYPSFKGIMAAKKKPLTKLSAADAGLDAGSVGLAGATSTVVDAQPAPPRQSGTIVKDEGDGGAKVAAFLAAQKLI
ncbi:Electron transfer flavoprotein alpha/beta-subunit [Parafrankia sp. EAN1pec]|nr:Electron transfer flavoprotein alpha/beta-subunit [Frankia sp. EAN1pec]